MATSAGTRHYETTLGLQALTLITQHDPRVLPAVRAERGRAGDELLEHARRLLSSIAGVSVTEVALACGFTDPTHFSRLFHQVYRALPTRYGLCTKHR